MNVLVTGAAGFIGYHVANALLERGESVTGFDNLNDYYDVTLKEARLQRLSAHPAFTFVKGDLADSAAVDALFAVPPFDRVIHLAAQAGVRYSLTHPGSYVQSNLVGFLHILEACRHAQMPHLTYASSSSVYGLNAHFPFSVHDNVDHPVSLYAATKKANELMAHTYSHLYNLPTTGLRFFTVYGPWGRPDMALFKFTKAILAGEPIDVYNHGRMRRDFTYIDDIVQGVVRTADQIAQPDPAWDATQPDPGISSAPYRVYNIGNHTPVELDTFITYIEEALGRKAVRNLLPMQPGDVKATSADVEDLRRAVGFAPATPLKTGITRFIEWYQDYYGGQA
ncbi:MAG: NAD-dependent epimerase [Kiritimatiellae bacterium]|nr:NAD-dependent epimerase [Kiritimatiellia bacterium]MDD4341157.1 NAD-dependent epimerase [Kiritimatiellia bacterium]